MTMGYEDYRESIAEKGRHLAEVRARTDANGHITPEQTAEAQRAAGLPDAPPAPPEPDAGPSDGGSRTGPPRETNLYRQIHDAEQAGDWRKALSLKSQLLAPTGPRDPVQNARQRMAAETTPNQ